MAYDVLSHFEEHSEQAGVVPVFVPVEGWSVWRFNVRDLDWGNILIEEELIAMRAALVVLDQDEHEQARMPLEFQKRVRSGRSAFLEGSDRAGALRVTAGVQLGGEHLSLMVTWAAGERTPLESLPALRFLAHLQPGRLVGVWLDEPGQWAATPIPWPYGPALDEGYLAAVETLDQVQRATGTTFPTPSELTRDDLNDLARAATLLSGDVLTSTWTEGTLTLSRHELEAFRNLPPDFVGQVEETGSFDITIGTEDIRVGIVSQRVLQFVLAEEEEVPGKPDFVRVRVVPGDDARMERKLVERAFFDPFARDIERVVVSEKDIARARQGKSLRDTLRSA